MSTTPDRAEFARRLLVLADFLDRLPWHRFDLTSWVGCAWKGAQDLSCGTTACALGWAATIPEFRDLGLRLRRNGEPGGNGFPTVDGLDPYATASVIFGLTLEEFDRLFIPFNGPGRHPMNANPGRVANVIRMLAYEWGWRADGTARGATPIRSTDKP